MMKRKKTEERRKEELVVTHKYEIYRSSVHPITIRPRFAFPTIRTGQFLQESHFRDTCSRGQYRELQESSWFSTKNENLSSIQKYSSQLSRTNNLQPRNKNFTCSRGRIIQERKGDVIPRSWRWHHYDCTGGEKDHVDNQLMATFRCASHCFRRKTTVSCLRARREE